MIHIGDCRNIMRQMADNTYDAIVTDPPYELGFMGKKWDSSGVAFDIETWAQALRVAKPGAYLAAFGGTRTWHRLVCVIEDAGWEIRDSLLWLYGSGMPKSHNGEWGGTALKPGWEPIVLARKPVEGTVAQNFARWGTGGLQIDACRIEHQTVNGGNLADNSHLRATINGGNGGHVIASENERRVVVPNAQGRWPANVMHDGSDEVLAAFPDAPGQMADASTRAGVKTSNVYGRMNREGEPSADSDNKGAVGFKMKPGARRLDAGSAARFFYCAKASTKDRNEGCEGMVKQMPSNAVDRAGQRSEGKGRGSRSGPRENNHPTVKPTDLMRYVLRLVTPPGGRVLDPFTGSGSTGKAAVLEGLPFDGIEEDEQWLPIIQARMAYVMKPEDFA